MPGLTVIVALSTKAPPTDARMTYEPCFVNLQPSKLAMPELFVGFGFVVQENPPVEGTDASRIESPTRTLPNWSFETTIGCAASAVPAVADVLGRGAW